MLKEKKNTLRETFRGKNVQMVRLYGIYTEENLFMRTSIQKGNILIENRHWRGNLLARSKFVYSKYSEEREMGEYILVRT